MNHPNSCSSRALGAGDYRPQSALFPRGTETLLVIDDEQVVLDVTCEMLRKLGYQVLPADSGEKGMEIFQNRSQEIRAVVLDLTMPGMKGEDCMTRLLALNPDLRILVATARLVELRRSDWVRDGSIRAIQKPFLFEDLAQQLRSVLDAPSRMVQPQLTVSPC